MFPNIVIIWLIAKDVDAFAFVIDADLFNEKNLCQLIQLLVKYNLDKQ